MKRDWNMDEVSDGKLYDLTDMAKIGCHDCQGCSDCCQNMGDSIILDPLDVHRLSQKLQMNFQQLLELHVSLGVVDGIILPHLKMEGEQASCSFLNEEGRCSIHEARPGMCRLFPLGRFYENRSFRYFVQIHECSAPNKTKEKISRWLDTPDLKKNQRYISDWHYFLRDLADRMGQVQDEELIKKVNMFVLNEFFIKPYWNEPNFYEQFNQRLERGKSLI